MHCKHKRCFVNNVDRFLLFSNQGLTDDRCSIRLFPWSAQLVNLSTGYFHKICVKQRCVTLLRVSLCVPDGISVFAWMCGCARLGHQNPWALTRSIINLIQFPHFHIYLSGIIGEWQWHPGPLTASPVWQAGRVEDCPLKLILIIEAAH